jgi:DNA-binding FadR family transcriptional regulator
MVETQERRCTLLLEARRTLECSVMAICVKSPANNDETTIRNAVQEVVRESESLRCTKTLGVKGMSSVAFVRCDWLHRNSGPGYGCVC